MVKMDLQVISLILYDGRVIARALATAPATCAEISVKLEFERGEQEPWQEARDRVLAVLDVAYV